MHLRTAGRRVAGVLATVLVGAGTLAAAAPAAQAAGPEVGFSAYAYGTSVFNADKSFSSGPTAYTGLSCTTALGKKSNNTAAVDLGKVGTAGATVTKVRSFEKGMARGSEASSTTAGVSLLGGIIKAKAITADAKATAKGGDWKAWGDSTLADLTILGKKIDVKPGVNTKISVGLPGLGKIAEVTLNEQKVRKAANGTFGITVNALHVKVLPGSQLGNKLNVDIYVARANAQLQPPTAGYLTGRAFATKISLLNGVVKSGETSLVAVPCLGGEFKNSIASADLGKLAKAGVAASWAKGNAGDPSKSYAQNEIAGVKLLGGLVTADAIKSVASAKKTSGGPVELSDKGSKFVNLKVGGKSILDTEIGPNTKITVGPIEVTLNKVYKSATTIVVTQIEIVVKSPTHGLPVNSKIQVSSASAGVLPTL